MHLVYDILCQGDIDAYHVQMQIFSAYIRMCWKCISFVFICHKYSHKTVGMCNL